MFNPNTKYDSFLVTIFVTTVSFFTVISPASWIAPFSFFQAETENGKLNTGSLFGDAYLLINFFLIIIMYSFLSFQEISEIGKLKYFFVINIIEIIQYLLTYYIIKPLSNTEFKSYSHLRRLIISLFHYVILIFLFSFVYIIWFVKDFKDGVNSKNAILEFSTVTMTTLGYGNLYFKAGTSASLVSSFQAICGVFFLALFVGVMASQVKHRE